MKMQSYYRLGDVKECNVCVDDRYLTVNCAGAAVLSEPFTTHNRAGRRDYYMMVMARGALEMYINGAPRAMRTGHMIIYPPETPYRYVKRDPSLMVYYWAHFTGYGAGEMLDGCGLETGRLYEIGDVETVTGAFRRLFDPFLFRDGCFEEVAAARLTLLCVQLRRALDGQLPADESGAANRIRRSLEYIHSHYAEPVTVAQLADMEHLSASRFSAAFRQSTGVSPRAYLIALRIRMAADMIRRTDLGFKQIARNVGYEDPLYFSRLFRAHTGLSPRRYREDFGGG
ncbi:MAG: helix-turn-helix transcriptional regulator [Clostridiales bacterium]|nr:helix-turn-helix transcriptional regulator [Clostridiales bacterium]